MRYEFTGGGSSKFWEIILEGRTFRVTWGRIGTAGQTQSKAFKTPSEARAAHDKLVAEKQKKGYHLAGGAAAKAPEAAKAIGVATTAKATPSRGGSATHIAKTAALIEAYSEKIKSLPALEVRPFILKPSSAAALASLERSLGLALPQDVKAFLERGLESVNGALEDPVATVGFDFLDAKKITKHTQMLRKIVAGNDEHDEHAQVIRQGLALTHSEPELVLSGDALYHFSFRNPLLRIARNFSEFLEHYLAAGCFSSHDFRALWKVVAPHVPVAIPPAKNIWISAYKKQFPSFWRP